MLGYTARDADEVAGCRALKDKYEWSDFMWTQISEIWSRFHENIYIYICVCVYQREFLRTLRGIFLIFNF